jgi:hypothetical protein
MPFGLREGGRREEEGRNPLSTREQFQKHTPRVGVYYIKVEG